MASSTITIDNTETMAMIEGLISKLKNPEPLLNVVGKYLQANTMKMFVGNRPDTSSVRGEKWPKLADSTIQRKLAQKKSGLIIGDARRPLVATGKMKDSLLTKAAIRVNKHGLVYGTEVRGRKGFLYPAAHQTGTSKMPQRRFLFVNETELNQIANTTKQWLEGNLMRQVA